MVAGVAMGVACGGALASAGSLTPACGAAFSLYSVATWNQYRIGQERVQNGEMGLGELIVDIAGPVASMPYTQGAPLRQRTVVFVLLHLIRSALGQVPNPLGR
jgi:hypothetical protein